MPVLALVDDLFKSEQYAEGYHIYIYAVLILKQHANFLLIYDFDYWQTAKYDKQSLPTFRKIFISRSTPVRRINTVL